MLDYWRERAEGEYVRPTQFAAIHSYLNEKHLAFEQLEKAYQEHDWMLTGPKADPDWDPLRDDPRFTDLLRRMNLEP